MPSIRGFYLRNVRRQVGASPVWPVSSVYKLGDYGYYSRATGKFSVRGNIFTDLKVPENGVLPPDNAPVTLLNHVLTSENTIKNDFKVDLDASPQVAHLEIAFQSGRSYVQHLYKMQVTQMRLVDAVKQVLSRADEAGKWDYRYRVVEILYKCPDVRFVFSLSGEASIVLRGTIEEPNTTKKAEIDYKIQSSSNMESSLWTEGAPSTPFVSFASFKRRELKLEDVKLLAGEDWYLEADNSPSFEEPTEGE